MHSDLETLRRIAGHEREYLTHADIRDAIGLPPTVGLSLPPADGPCRGRTGWSKDSLLRWLLSDGEESRAITLR
jgi:hypothetical protein